MLLKVRMVNKYDGQGQGTETEATAWFAASQWLAIWSPLKATSRSRLCFPDLCCPSTNYSVKGDWPLQFLNGKCALVRAGRRGSLLSVSVACVCVSIWCKKRNMRPEPTEQGLTWAAQTSCRRAEAPGASRWPRSDCRANLVLKWVEGWRGENLVSSAIEVEQRGSYTVGGEQLFIHLITSN